jgi:hypothetical protein
MRLKPLLPIAALLALAGSITAQDALDVKYKGAAWLQFGRVMHSTDSLVNGGSPNNMNGNWIEAAGTSLSSVARFSPHWEGGMGMGLIQGHNARGDVSVANNWYTTWGTFVSEARVTYTNPITERQKLQFNMGFFPFNYSPESKNLGMYLLRGYVYPGSPISGFEARGTTGAANIFGAMGSYSIGGFKNDLLVISETENRPYFDLSVADVVTWKPGAAFELGAGVNLYRVMPRKKENNSPGKDCKNVMSTYSNIDGDEKEVCYILDTVSVDASGAKVDTILGSMSGTKLMGRFRVDPKQLLGLGDTFGKQDLVLYGEVGVLGTTNYRKYYDDIKRRMPVMMGINIPAFGWLDKFAFEAEYYASKNMLDYGKAETSYSWVPRTAPDVDNARDDWKWSLYFSKIVQGHLRISGQVANDHLRMFGPPDIGFISYAETLTTPKDWYWMLKTTYFF